MSDSIEPWNGNLGHHYQNGIDRNPNAAMRRCHPNGQQPLCDRNAQGGQQDRFSWHAPAYRIAKPVDMRLSVAESRGKKKTKPFLSASTHFFKCLHHRRRREKTHARAIDRGLFLKTCYKMIDAKKNARKTNKYKNLLYKKIW